MRLTINSRLQLALNSVIVAISMLAALGMILLVFWFEDTLFYNHLKSDLADHVHNYQAVSQSLVLSMTDTTYYKLHKDDQHLLPQEFRGYPEGGSELLLPNKSYNVFVQTEPDWIHVLVQDQSEFERYEMMAFSGIGVGVLLIWIIGFMASRRMSQEILKPISNLANEVASLSRQPGAGLIRNYPNDETGQLARTFDHYVVRVNELLLREQQFSANASHELRTPMMVMRGALDMLAEDELAPAVTRQLQRIGSALEQMQQQAELFLQLSRTPDSLAGDGELRPLAELVAAQLAHWQPVADSRGLQLELEVNGNVPAQAASMMVAVLNNLLRNAMQHTNAGKITVQLTAEYLRVSDTGTGMTTEMQAHALERGVTAANPKGFGLGLAIVKQICEHQGWRLDFSPRVGGGTQVTVYFVTSALAATDLA